MSAPDADAARTLLLEAGEPDPGRLEVRSLPGGASRELWTLASEGAHSPAYVLRRDPPGETPRTSREREHAVQSAAFAAGVPVPRPLAFEPAGGRLDTASMLMEWVGGEAIPRRVLRDERLAGARASLARSLGEALGALQRVEPSSFGTPPADPAAAALESLRAELDACGDALQTLELGLRWLELGRPPPRAVRVVHGDFRLGNFIVAAERLRAVVDWKFWHLGDPLVDVAWVCTRPWRFGIDDRPVAGCGALEDLLEGLGEDVERERLLWWEVLCQVKWGVYCANQATLRRRGQHESLERTVLARRVAEAEWDMLALMRAAR